MLVGSTCIVAAAFVVAKKKCLKPSGFLVLFLVPGIACRWSILFFGLQWTSKSSAHFCILRSCNSSSCCSCWSWCSRVEVGTLRFLCRYFVFCEEGTWGTCYLRWRSLRWLVSVKKELDVSVAIFAIRKFLHFLCGFRGGSTPGTFVGLNKPLWFCWNMRLCVCGFLCNDSNLRLFCSRRGWIHLKASRGWHECMSCSSGCSAHHSGTLSNGQAHSWWR